tara:strand:+ start:496 stop:600 length:105 start_codon:yes stop_codon:yes gene_type:complete
MGITSSWIVVEIKPLLQDYSHSEIIQTILNLKEK